MARSGASLEELFDRPYRPGAAFGPRISPLRRWGMVAVLLLLIGVIVTYWVLTDTRRVREMAQDYLSRLTGGHVEVKNATLSIFEGLRLDGVTVRVDDDPRRPDSTIFRAETFLIKYNPQSILSGHLEATQIVALDPQVFLCEDLDKGRWNFQRAEREVKTTTRGTPGPRMKFPEILLRNAQITYSRLRDGRMLTDRGLMEIEGTLKPTGGGTFAFALQSRGGADDSIGPAVRGNFDVDSKAVSASLENFRFGKEIEVMLPQQVRDWWTQHGLAGSIDIPHFEVTPAHGGQRMKFRIETDLRNVNLDIHPEEWISREEGRRLVAMRQSMAFMRALGLDSGGFVSEVEQLFNPSVIELDKVTGRLVFTEDGIDVVAMGGWLEKNPFTINGHIEGYSPQAAATMTVVGENIAIPHNPRYVNSLPPAFRELYDHLRPEGEGSLWLKLHRDTPGAKPLVSGRLDIHNGLISFDHFPYPLRAIKGLVTFGWDERSRMNRVDVRMNGFGTADGPNRDVPVDVKGFVGPLGKEAEFDFWVQTSGVTSEPALNNAYPPPVREALKIFDAPGKGEYPKYHGGFVANVHRPPGLGQTFQTRVWVDLDDAQGTLTFFPYPVEHLTGKLFVTEDHVDLIDVAVKKGDATLNVGGSVHYGKDKPIDPRITVTGRGIPIDAQLLAALPQDRGQWLRTIGLGGRLDVDGFVRRQASAASPTTLPTEPHPAGAHPGTKDIGYDLQLRLSHGTVLPDGKGEFAARDLTGTMRLTPTEFVVHEIKGRRGDGQLFGSGRVDWGQGARPAFLLSGSARNLMLDAGLYQLLPPTWREGWDQAKPEGTVDLDVTYRGAVDSPSTTRPSAGDFQVDVRPVKLAITPRVIPARLENVKGELQIRPDHITLKDITATRKSGGTIAYSGTVPAGDKRAGGAWDLKLSAKDIEADEEMRRALPPAVSRLMESLKVTGKVTADFSKLVYRANPNPAVSEGDLDLSGVITVAGNTFEIGVPITDAAGRIAIDAAVRRGKLAGLTGGIDLATLKAGGREIKNFKCELFKPSNADALRIGKISADVAGGALAGQVDLAFPETGASRFGVGLVLRNADVATLAGPTEKDIKGQLTASLAIEGDWGDPSTRRGRGDVSVVGKEMYRIPLVLGLMQITNLSLPISSPFNEAAARYTVEGQRISFEQLELRASNMLMSGTGWLDFATRKVKMTFVTDNPNAWRIPFITEILQGARQEFMQIHVNGTIQEPKVSAGVMSTFTTTIDEVFDRDKHGAKRGARK
jgi:hypothetical protein